jgi:D-arginine dehydrogenase
MSVCDVAIIGAGIAGTSLAEALASHLDVLLLEAEVQPGYHSTGRSAAFWSETYGGPLVQPLTSASGPFLASPPSNFSESGFLAPRGALYIGTAADSSSAIVHEKTFEKSGVRIERLRPDEIASYVPGLKQDYCEALWEPECCDIDVAALHAAYLRVAKRKGAKLHCRARMEKAAYRAGAWDVSTDAGQYRARLLVNAAGAWADDVAKRALVNPIGIQPFRRTMVQLAITPGAPPDLPLVIGLDGSFYFKPDTGGKVWLSPHDETPWPACDVAPEELDVAKAIDRLEDVVDWKIDRLEHKWAGLRSFAPDRLPVIGRDSNMPDFFWLAGQGGFGIQTAPAIAQLAASMIVDGIHAPSGVEGVHYHPARFR